MRKFTFLLAALTILLSSCNYTKNTSKNNDQPYLVVLSLDGFRWDYADSVNTPNLDKIAKMGVKAKSMQASFPTKTFPNHYAIATGLYPNNNGIVNNTFVDLERDLVYSIRNRNAVEDGEFYDGEPIWNTAEKQNVKAATFYWVGSEADIQNMRPTIWKPYEHNFPFEQRIDTVISWLERPNDKRPHLIMWYMHEPDLAGHKFGPHSDETNLKVAYLDSLVGVFMDKLSQIPIAKSVNVIVLSDHGMGSISDDKQVYLDKILKPEWTTNIVGSNPFYNIKATDGSIDSILYVLGKTKGITSYKISDIPKRLHYGANPRTLDIIAVADSSYSLFNKSGRKYSSNGTHGYDNRNTDMDAIYYAYGPAFKENYEKERFINVSLYPLFCKILGLNEAPNDGDLSEVIDMLK
ncbi:MAG: ectonucleotide pyrophosphatase/phosphodiesterase [Bacteroidales bacterium]|jgi:predicted AlkP superfamily pyrophosphatase or phosphodiesterase|nr:ectonucleotide pyrophosphatase/phosphodiesterase [Bacteroidales bacterium]